jgi:asparagine synthase (glutamine-hydrolysing)
MCAIAGIFSPGQQVDPQQVRSMTDAMRHRGPDDSGLEVVAGGRLALGHRRLSILDLSSLGHQPMRHPSGRLWITFNGEIYNFREIRAELEAAGDSFHSESDTEVILAAYSRWGRDCLRRFRGMFAIALWDADRESLLLIRDRFGVKPLYYSLGCGRFAFASEMRGLLAGTRSRRVVDVTAATEFLRFGYVSAPQSLLSDVAALPPGCVLEVGPGLSPVIEPYWSPRDMFESDAALALRREIAALDEESVLDRMEQALTDAFALRMVADVPVGLFLSGGIDSTVVATLLARRLGIRPKTFTIGYSDSRFNEIPYAREIARELGTEHTELEVSETLALQTAERLLDDADEPIGDSSIIPTYIVCELARRSVKVALSADGADELLGGYPRYDVCGRFAEAMAGWRRFAYFASAELLDLAPPGLIRRLYHVARRGGPGYAAIDDKVRKFVRMARSGSAAVAYDAAITEFSERDAHSLLATTGGQGTHSCDPRNPLRCSGAREQFMLTDIQYYLPSDLLTKLDRTSMAVSLEAREPFLDQHSAAIAAALPMHWKIRGHQGKYVLRRLLARHLRSDLFNRPKQGFSAPVGAWMRGVLRSRVEETLSASAIRQTGLLDPRAVDATVRRFMTEGGVSAAGLWHILQLQSWGARWAPTDQATPS